MPDYCGVRRVELYEIRYTDDEGWIGLVVLSWSSEEDDIHARYYKEQSVEIPGETKAVVKKRVEWFIGAIQRGIEEE